MISLSLLSVFVPTFFMVSLTPGMCMTLSMTLGMTIGVRRALWMMLGELVGVGLVAVSAVVGVATLMLRYPEVFAVFKWVGGAYLIYLGVMMWRSKGRLAIPEASDAVPDVSRVQLIVQGFVTAVANPKGWAFFIALLPPFLESGRPLAPQLVALVGVILTLELTCLLIYAGGGRTASRFLRRSGNVQLLNRIAGSLMVGVGIWLALG
ncbi:MULTISPECIES: LysE family translocator [Chromohalobacter]|uniref:Lysine exporter protein (LYSE/YGGA) n=1 Tax=Chromohalobacter israelensis (strain ATCC BAA-138 / DSM 3043 / CIP 106854 / NCIMB 13768 / 1H11) TaxID=290398 RepID=Q1QXB8_CHRI1|nr:MULTISPECIES: LysE family translocator [Chromohalobacter]ABE58890.1 Lysine exporter protein (LYSE/YGGA) [Chromohalobacter salexigens DSM 3043]MBZ5877207.1 LysE family translocator [Chromohalobacter salexigens]MDF9433652.1 LysE family translocator [Chromohalobacter israelensis]MDO0944972.1 LysE family translocator [Chromohalobacter salexigens]NQY44503.1 LysE family translocator [Chromohalobacter sp.]